MGSGISQVLAIGGIDVILVDIPSLITSKETVDSIEAFTKRIRKDAIMARDYPGFTVNRLLVPFLNEAICLVFRNSRSKDFFETVI